MGIDYLFMRRLVSTLLLFCFGMFIPAVGMPLNICLADSGMVRPSFQSCGEVAEGEPSGKCCSDGGHKEESPQAPPCCFETGTMPDGMPPGLPLKIAPPLFTVLEFPEFQLNTFETPEAAKTQRILPHTVPRPDTSSERRALLSIWRI